MSLFISAMGNIVVAKVKAPPVLDPATTMTATMHVWWNNAIKMLPSLIAAIAFLAFAWLVGKLVARGIRKVSHRRGSEDLGAILGSIAFGLIMVLGFMIAAAIAFPSVQPGNILATLGIGSVAVGFAFKDILQNLFAGILLLINRPFRRGDQIVLEDYEGTVEHIQSRATLIKTYDGRRVIIPNADIYTSPVMVNTAFKVRRDQLDVGIGYDDEPAKAAELLLAAIKGIEGVEADPAPVVIPIGLGESDITLRAKWWTQSSSKVVTAVRSKVVLAVFETLRSNGIELPYPSQIVMLQDEREDEPAPMKKVAEPA